LKGGQRQLKEGQLAGLQSHPSWRLLPRFAATGEDVVDCFKAFTFLGDGAHIMRSWDDDVSCPINGFETLNEV
jgi:hypothetical protein